MSNPEERQRQMSKQVEVQLHLVVAVRTYLKVYRKRVLFARDGFFGDWSGKGKGKGKSKAKEKGKGKGKGKPKQRQKQRQLLAMAWNGRSLVWIITGSG